MKSMLTAGALGLALVLSLSACDRQKTAAPATPATPAVAADTSVQEFRKIDTVEGTGKVAGPGMKVTVNYTGWLFAPNEPGQKGAKFDSSVGREPFTFLLGGGQVIKGWDQGVDGMKVGGKRTLVIPAALGYGDDGIGPIPPKANLIFDVELLDVN
ncbi:FKBP-type peptidyl-prolyl cis-trans isomerase [uncultured Massilia sp.]|uniref:FKBP-type peptidyl-prolyl cis-trans isomerase n=1 Tax=uncultured Massilia sp. TaxID=169973 RepID=UPI0025E6155B|nr:FKBP-type peptidyl-prolyl cis-trans isomerase [uncultured Massilia sp.]